MMHQNTLTELNEKIISCEQCPRLRDWCQSVALEKIARFQEETYWGKPVPSFGDASEFKRPSTPIIIVGLAPAAHGANRTGRMFTGDRSGEWLYRALHRAGFANQPHSISKEDGLQLKDCYITATVRCAPPGNKPTPEEIKACRPYLTQEFQMLEQAKVYIGLGKIAFDAIFKEIENLGLIIKPKPKFGHGVCIPIQLPHEKHQRLVIGSYHPSQQNTFTGKLTEPMFDEIFHLAKQYIQGPK
jgi:uracil-DNA glycosylase